MQSQSIACVYSITHVPSGRVYIGSTSNVKVRWKNHRQELKRGVHKNARLQAAWTSDGETSFVFAIVELVEDSSMLKEAEQNWLNSLRPFEIERGFNIDFNARSRIGRPRTAEQIERSAAAHRGLKRSASTRAKISAKARGRVASNRRFSEEQIVSIRALLASGVSDSAIGREFNAAPQVIRRIRIGESYPIIE